MQGLQFQRILNARPEAATKIRAAFLVYVIKRDGGRVSVGTVSQHDDGKWRCTYRAQIPFPSMEAAGAHLAQRRGFHAVDIVL